MATPLAPRFRVVLLLSLALNVLLGAALASVWWQHQERGRGIGGAVHMPRAEALAKVLPDGDRAALDAAYARHRPEVRASFQGMREARREVRAALTASPFDAARLERALTAMREHEARVAEAVHALLTDVSSSVSEAGRAAIAKQVTSRRHGHGSRRDRRPPHEQRPEEAPNPTP